MSSISWIILLISSTYRIISGLVVVSTLSWGRFYIKIEGYAIISGLLNLGAVYGLVYKRKLGLSFIVIDLILNLINRYLIYHFVPMFTVDLIFTLIISVCVYLEYRHTELLDDISL